MLPTIKFTLTWLVPSSKLDVKSGTEGDASYSNNCLISSSLHANREYNKPFLMPKGS